MNQENNSIILNNCFDDWIKKKCLSFIRAIITKSHPEEDFWHLEDGSYLAKPFDADRMFSLHM